MLLWLTFWCKPVICNTLEIQNQIRGNKNKTTANFCPLNLTYKIVVMTLKFARKTTECACIYVYIFLVLYIYIKVTFTAQAFFPDAQQSKSWYPFTQRECCEQDQIRVISAFDLSRQSISTTLCMQSCFPLARCFSWRLSAKTLLSLSVTSGLTRSLCWDSDWGMWGLVLTQVVLLFAAHIIFRVQMQLLLCYCHL